MLKVKDLGLLEKFGFKKDHDGCWFNYFGSNDIYTFIYVDENGTLNTTIETNITIPDTDDYFGPNGDSAFDHNRFVDDVISAVQVSGSIDDWNKLLFSLIKNEVVVETTRKE